MNEISNCDDFSHTPLESALFEISECAVNTRSIKDYAKELHRIIGKLMYAENFFVVLYEQDKSLLEFVYMVDENEADCDLPEMLSESDLRRTLTGYMLKSGQMQHLSAADSNRLVKQDIVDEVGEQHFDWLGVPLLFNDEVLGGLVIQSYSDSNQYGPKEEDILQFVARQIALFFKSKQAETALIDSNIELEQRVKSRMDELKKINEELAVEILQRKRNEKIQTALYKITELVNTAPSLNDFYLQVHKNIASLMPANNEYIALLSEDSEYIEFPYFVDQIDPSPIRRKLDLNKDRLGMTEKIFISGKPLLFRREKGHPTSPEGSNCVSFLGVPLKEGRLTFGVLAVQSYQEDVVYDQKNKDVLNTIGQQVATAILRKKDAESLRLAHEGLEIRVKERTVELEKTIEKRRRIEEKLAHDSLHDALTGLPNRLQFSNRLNQVLQQGEEQPASVLGLLFLDLDRFKIINDSLGHHIGDLFLKEVASRLKSCLRADDLVARLGGDEFCILMPDIPKPNAAFKLCARILKELKRPVVVANHSLMTSASIGVRLASHTEKSAELIMSDADAAMYQAKHQGKNRFCVFDSEIKKIVTGRMKMERDLRDAVDSDEFFLVYQPIVDLNLKQVVGFEALLRWEHPESGYVSPSDFIPVAEETGLIVDIGEQVIKKACQTLASFSNHSQLANLYINVNVSSIQILSRTLDDFIRQNLSDYKVEHDKLNIEITESILIDDYIAALAFVRELKAMGVKIYLDDFGTGYSSLSYLHKFPFDAIKLDRSFILAISENENNEAIVDSIAQLAKNLKIHIVAEGIETLYQLNAIRKMDYPAAQGYLFSKPLAKSDIELFVSNFTIAD